MFNAKQLTPILTIAALSALLTALPARAETATALFAGGCFWCMESDFQGSTGVVDVVSGFTGGSLKNPTYSGNHSGHYEAVRITYDPAVISYAELLQAYWPSIDPFDSGGQFCDRGDSYRAAVFVADARERQLAEESLAAVKARFGEREIATEILPATQFWPVEDYHQDYFEKNPVRYNYYRWRCGRDSRLREIWGADARSHQ